MTQSSVEPNRTAVCLLENATKEIHLHCGDEAAIHVKSVQQGYQDLPQDTTFCTFQVIFCATLTKQTHPQEDLSAIVERLI